ncbi:MAG TPA: SpoIIE family protein phosphatase [Baekduia sp.]|nr:SpoIIE family protein phosphatase [Baekduia sp.]
MQSRDLLQPGLIDELFEAMPAALALVDADLRVVRVNGQMAALTGRDAGPVIGVSVTEALGNQAQSVEARVARALAGEVISKLPLHPVTPDSLQRFVASYLPVGGPDGVTHVLIVLAETSDGEDIERRLQFSREQLELTLEGTGAGIFEWRSATNELRWSDGMGPLFGRERGWAPDNYEHYMSVVHPDDHAPLVSDIKTALETGAGYEREFRAIWPNGREYWLQSRVQAIGGDGSRMLLGIVLDGHRRKRREQTEALLARVSVELGQSLDRDVTLRRLAELLVPEVADWCEIALLDDRSEVGSLTVVHADPELEPLARRVHELNWASSRTGELLEDLRSGETRLSTGTGSEAPLSAFAESDEQREGLRRLHPSSVLTVPLLSHGRLFGALSLFAASEARNFGPRRVGLAEEIARRAATAIENVMLFESQQAATRQLQHLQAVTDATLDNLELDDLLQELLRRISAMRLADFAAILLYDSERGDLEMTASQDLPEIGPVRIGPGEGVAGQVLSTGEMLYVENVRSLSRTSALLSELGDHVESVLALPLLVDDEIVGVLEVGTLDEPREFSDSELELLTLAAERAARGIVNASLYTQARAASTMLQGSLLPDSLPAIAGYEIAAIYRPGQDLTEVGGDLYDVFELPDGRFAIAIGDVVGRGIRAAGLMGQLRAATRAYAREHSDPAVVMSQVDHLVEELVAVPFATMVLLMLDPVTGTVVMANAGHPPPILKTSGLAALAGGPPLGTPVDAPRVSQALQMDPGEVLVLYTDGMVELRSERLGDRLEALAAAVSSGPTDPEALLAHLEQVMLTGETRDDTAAVALRRVS